MNLRVILADDHRVFLDGLCKLLVASEIDVVASVTDRDELPELIARLRPDVVVVDVSMRGVGIPELIQSLRRSGIATGLLVLTGSSPYTLAEDLLAAGAKGFLLKDNAFEGILEAIHEVAAGGTYVSPEVATELLGPRNGRPEHNGGALTLRQREILRLVAAGETSKRIAALLGIHVKTVDHHRQLIREKLGARSSAEMVRLAKDRGLF